MSSKDNGCGKSKIGGKVGGKTGGKVNDDYIKGECPICCDTFTKILRRAVVCPCGFTVCKKCARTYIMENVDHPRCINPSCKITWSQEFMYENLDKIFIDGEYKEIIKNNLFELEKANFRNHGNCSFTHELNEEQSILTDIKDEKKIVKMNWKMENLKNCIFNFVIIIINIITWNAHN